ncbi:MAG: mannose-1-phosphate guanylyltransferase [Phycisphaerae bacterium]
MEYAVIMAGGAGKRLWPLSRQDRPKQLLKLIHGKSLLEMAVERLQGLFDERNILIITNESYADIVADALDGIPRQQIIGEPEGRDTANAIALAAAVIAGKDPDATMAVFTADHVIRPADKLGEAVRKAFDTVKEHPDALLTFGVRPTWPHTGLGYIHCGEKLDDGVKNVSEFKEKPDHHTARRYVESGQHYWNSGMFVWKVATIQQMLQQFLPDTAEKLAPVTSAVADGQEYTPVLREVYPTLEKISIDFAVMEKAPRVLMVELNCEWLDVGSWPALENVCSLDGSGNVLVAENEQIMDSFRNVVVTEDDHLLAVLGVDDCVIVHSPDATLVCNKQDAYRLKELVNALERKFGKKYL